MRLVGCFKQRVRTAQPTPNALIQYVYLLGKRQSFLTILVSSERWRFLCCTCIIYLQYMTCSLSTMSFVYNFCTIGNCSFFKLGHFSHAYIYMRTGCSHAHTFCLCVSLCVCMSPPPHHHHHSSYVAAPCFCLGNYVCDLFCLFYRHNVFCFFPREK